MSDGLDKVGLVWFPHHKLMERRKEKREDELESTNTNKMKLNRIKKKFRGKIIKMNYNKNC